MSEAASRPEENKVYKPALDFIDQDLLVQSAIRIGADPEVIREYAHTAIDKALEIKDIWHRPEPKPSRVVNTLGKLGFSGNFKVLPRIEQTREHREDQHD